MKRLAYGCCAALWLSACSGSEGDAAATSNTQPPTERPSPTAPAVPPPLYDSAGNLLSSGEKIAWLELPRGLTKLPVSAGTFHAYVAKGIALDRIQAFFGARVLASRVERLGKSGVRLADGIPPTGSAPAQARIEVTVVPDTTEGQVSVRIVEQLPLTPVPKFTTADARALLKQEQKSAE